jgi:PilZ domain
VPSQSVSARPNLSDEARLARRFALQIPVRYRFADDATWRHGETENISSSGVLFRGQSAAREGTQLELCLMLPVTKAEGGAEVICRGVIVRSTLPAGGRELPVLAARILHFRLARG